MGILESLGMKNLLEATEGRKSAQNTKVPDVMARLRGAPKQDPLNESFYMEAGALVGDDSHFGGFIGDSFYDTGGVFGRSYNHPGTHELEKSYILQQRSASLLPEVAIGIEEIMKDLYDKSDPMTLNINLLSSYEDKDKEKLIKEAHLAFEDFKRKPFTIIGNNQTPSVLMFFNLLKQAYIDGHLCIYAVKVPVKISNETAETAENKTRMNEDHLINTGRNKSRGTPSWYQAERSMVHGFKSTPIREPKINEDYFDLRNMKAKDLDILLEFASKKDGKSAFAEKLIFIPLDPTRLSYDTGTPKYDLSIGKVIELNESMIIQADFGLFDGASARYGFLQYAFKYANQLQSLQDMLVPMRFRRSVARRIFNVDVGNLPQSRASAFMAETQRKFKYKKSYDSRSGKIKTGEGETVGIVEDYWFANRAGSKGTSVEMLDEAGNFADSLEDITYFNKKLYQSMFIPLRRIFESDSEYDYTANSIEIDEMRFNSFLDRMRFVFNAVLDKMFKIYLEDIEMDEEIIDGTSVTLRYDNWFERNKKFESFEKALSLFDSAKENMGKIYSAETLMKTVFNMNPADVQNEINKIKSEVEPDSIFFPLYNAIAADQE